MKKQATAEFKIEKNVPIPSRNTNGRKRKYPYDVLKVGESFHVPGGTYRNMYLVSYAWAKRAGKKRKFVVRKETRGVRVWRAA